MKGYPLFFKIRNETDRDACSFCGGKGPLIKALSTGKSICPSCVPLLVEAVRAEPLALPMHQPIEA